MYFNDATGSKMSYHLQTKVLVKAESCVAGQQQLEGVTDLTYTAKSPSVRELNEFVTGPGTYGTPKGEQLVIMQLYCPRDGEIGSVRVAGEPVPVDAVDDSGRALAKAIVQTASGRDDSSQMARSVRRVPRPSHPVECDARNRFAGCRDFIHVALRAMVNPYRRGSRRSDDRSEALNQTTETACAVRRTSTSPSVSRLGVKGPHLPSATETHPKPWGVSHPTVRLTIVSDVLVSYGSRWSIDRGLQLCMDSQPAIAATHSGQHPECAVFARRSYRTRRGPGGRRSCRCWSACRVGDIGCTGTARPMVAGSHGRTGCRSWVDQRHQESKCIAAAHLDDPCRPCCRCSGTPSVESLSVSPGSARKVDSGGTVDASRAVSFIKRITDHHGGNRSCACS